MGPTCWLKFSCPSSCCYPVISILMQACRHLIPMFFSLSTIPIVHLYTSLSRSSYPFPYSSLQDSSILHHTHFPLIHSPPHSLTYMESHGCMLSFTPSHTQLTQASISIQPTKPVSLSKLSPMYMWDPP